MTPEDWEYIYKVNIDKCNEFDYPSELPPVRRIIVLGDIHGDMGVIIKSLKDVAKVINNELKWIGEDTVIVQLGDQIDSCRPNGLSCIHNTNDINDTPYDIKILVFLTQLHEQAQKYGGAVYSLVGNHEIMNVGGNMAYVSYQNIKEFENLKLLKKKLSKKKLSKKKLSKKKLSKKKVLKNVNTIEIDEDYKYDLNIDEILEKRKLMFRPGNPIANFLACTRKLVLKIGSNLFVHAGIIDKISKSYKITEINRLLALYLRDTINKKNKEEYHKMMEIINNPEGPLWTRKFSTPFNGKINCDELLKSLTTYQVGRIYVGHTPQIMYDKGINGICDGKIWLTDYGASHAFDTISTISENTNRVVQVLEILDDNKLTVLKYK